MIDFLHPGYLPIAAAAIVPVVIHLLQRHRARVVEFSSVALLHGAERRTIRRFRLRQILLMILRSLILLLIGLALAHPVVTGLGRPGIAGHLPTALAIAVDNSMSMGWVSDGRSLLDRGLDRVRETLGRLREGDRVVLLYVPEAGAAPASVEGADAIREALSGIRPLPIRIGAMELAVAAAGRLEEIDGLHREVHLYTDLQGTAFGPVDADIRRSAAPPGVVGERDRERGGADRHAGAVFPGDTRLVLLTERTGEAWNGAVTDLRIAEAPLTPAGGVRLEGTVRFRGPEGAAERVLVHLRREGGGREVRDVSLGEDGTGAFAFSLDGALEGIVRGSVEVDPDPLSADDRRCFTVRMPGRPRVWFPPRGKGATPLRMALRVLAEEVGSIDLEERVPEVALERRDVLLIESARAGDADRLGPLIAGGPGPGALLVVPPSEPTGGSTLALNGLLSRLGLAERYGGRARPGGEGYARIDRWPSVTGETRRFLDEYDAAVQAIHVRRFLPIDRNPVAPDEPGRESIDLHTGEPWVVILPTVSGGWRVLFATGFGPEWGGLYRDPLFLPLLDTLLRDLVGRGGLVSRSYRPGERAEIDLPGVPDGVPVDLVRQEGTREEAWPEGGVLRRTIRGAPGNVSIEVGGRDLGGYAVNPDGEESNLVEADSSAIAAAFGRGPVPVVRGGAGLEDTLFAARGGRDVWDGLLLLALLFLLLEGGIANRGLFGARRVERGRT